MSSQGFELPYHGSITAPVEELERLNMKCPRAWVGVFEHHVRMYVSPMAWTVNNRLTGECTQPFEALTKERVLSYPSQADPLLLVARCTFTDFRSRTNRSSSKKNCHHVEA